ncbi:hypothetical protein GGS21DRAFT_83841 [Xylaria nigripes]|nr:hypothetical protein GGS21DRAFT_83841 [Xylaria nigripes]
MASNSGRGNTIDAADGPKGGDVAPPPVTDEVKRAVKEAARAETEGGAMTMSTSKPETERDGRNEGMKE